MLIVYIILNYFSFRCQLLRDNGQVCCQCFRLERSLVKKLWQQSKEATANNKHCRAIRNYRSLSHNDKNLLISKLKSGKKGDKRKIVKLQAEVGELKQKIVSLKEQCSQIQQESIDHILDNIKNRQVFFSEIPSSAPGPIYLPNIFACYFPPPLMYVILL